MAVSVQVAVQSVHTPPPGCFPAAQPFGTRLAIPRPRLFDSDGTQTARESWGASSQALTPDARVSQFRPFHISRMHGGQGRSRALRTVRQPGLTWEGEQGEKKVLAPEGARG